MDFLARHLDPTRSRLRDSQILYLHPRASNSGYRSKSGESPAWLGLEHREEATEGSTRRREGCQGSIEERLRRKKSVA